MEEARNWYWKVYHSEPAFFGQGAVDWRSYTEEWAEPLLEERDAMYEKGTAAMQKPWLFHPPY
jgi:hypothetical protein